MEWKNARIVSRTTSSFDVFQHEFINIESGWKSLLQLKRGLWSCVLGRRVILWVTANFEKKKNFHLQSGTWSDCNHQKKWSTVSIDLNAGPLFSVILSQFVRKIISIASFHWHCGISCRVFPWYEPKYYMHLLFLQCFLYIFYISS